ncbi:Hypothetical protein GLP15_868 [Giardia lamblia P15]|uniref:Uncharacterized protein n=1 Tax=Giardia intestinalis (strain P15) TaxID=658858 RepID=E1F3S8_GIAIA|nr:Hypothetical protein GLP15_868 [Giardia lamblia P15]
MPRQADSLVHETLQRARGVCQMVTQAYLARQGWPSDGSYTSKKHAFPPELRLSGRQIKKRLLDSTICIQRAWRQQLRAEARLKHCENCRIAAALGGSAGYLYIGGLAGPRSLAADIVEKLSRDGKYSSSAAAAIFARRWKLLRAFFALKRARFCAPRDDRKRG